jgi:autotransporter translocation and assembly factor TamB
LRRAGSLEPGRAAGLESSLARLTSEFALEVALDQLREYVGEYLPFDSVAVARSAEGSDTTIEVARYVGEDVFIRYGSTLGSDAQDVVRLEWRLTPSLSVESSVSSSGKTGADLLWRRDY